MCFQQIINKIVKLFLDLVNKFISDFEMHNNGAMHLTNMEIDFQ